MTGLYGKKPDQTLEITGLNSPQEWHLWCDAELDDDLEDFVGPYSFKPEIDECNFKLVSEAIKIIVDPYFKEIAKSTENDDPKEGEYLLTGLNLEGRWNPKKRVFNYTLEPNVHFVNEKEAGKTVKLYD